MNSLDVYRFRLLADFITVTEASIATINDGDWMHYSIYFKKDGSAVLFEEEHLAVAYERMR